jgi:hypothetical protein
MASTALNTSLGKENVPPVMTAPLAFSRQPTLPGIETSHLPSNPMQLSVTGSASSDSLSSVDNMRPSKRQRTADAQREFNEDFCKMLVATGSAWNFANNPEVRHFFGKWTPGVIVPDRRTLSGPVLDGLVTKVENVMKVNWNGKLAMGQCDGWKNTAKQSVVASVVTVASQVCFSRSINNCYRLMKTHPIGLSTANAQCVCRSKKRGGVIEVSPI